MMSLINQYWCRSVNTAFVVFLFCSNQGGLSVLLANLFTMSSKKVNVFRCLKPGLVNLSCLLWHLSEGNLQLQFVKPMYTQYYSSVQQLAPSVQSTAFPTLLLFFPLLTLRWVCHLHASSRAKKKPWKLAFLTETSFQPRFQRAYISWDRQIWLPTNSTLYLSTLFSQKIASLIYFWLSTIGAPAVLPVSSVSDRDLHQRAHAVWFTQIKDNARWYLSA